MPVGTRIGRYEVRGLLGAGGMGAVYDAYDADLDRAVALKVLRAELGDVPGFADRLVHESRLTAKVAHASVIAVYDAGREGDTVFIAMELIRGGTLTAWLAANRLDWRAIVVLFERAGEGLAAAHKAGIVHRDFKPDNVLVAHEARKVVVTDFGIAREVALPRPLAGAHGDTAAIAITIETEVPHALRGDSRMTTDGAVIGTPAYMAPEQITGRRVDLRADLFAFSTSLWEALFHARPFPGESLVEIFAGMHEPPVRPPAGAPRVPRRLLRALARGLAFEPDDRWPDMPAMLAELAQIRAHHRRIALAAGGAGVLAAIVAAAFLIARPEPAVDRCATALAALDHAYGPAREPELRAVLAHEPAIQRAVTARFAATAEAWRATQRATCHADRDVAQDPKTTACLDARRLELAGSVDDVIAGGPASARYATLLSELPGLPAACASPASGLLFARVPADRELRRKVTALRERLADADAARERADFAQAIATATAVAAAATAVWLPVHAEAQLALGRLQSQGGDSKLALRSLREAAGAAERAHDDEVAATSWIAIAIAVADDEGDPARGLEYITYAEAAADRIGRPARVMARLEYTKGIALVAANRSQDGELALHKAAELAQTTSAADRARAYQGLGYLYNEQGRYADAVTAYRQAIEQLPRSPSGQIVGDPVYFERLAVNLSLIGQPEQAELEARRAVEIADRTLPETQLDRAIAHVNLSQILQNTEHYPEALVEITAAVAAVGAIQGTRSERYGEVLGLQGDLLTSMERYAEAEPLLARACDVIAFVRGDDHAQVASCELGHAMALAGLHRDARALVMLNRVVSIMVKVYGEAHPEVGAALTTRGIVHATLGHHPAAIADFQRAIASLTGTQIEPGFLASAEWRLGKELWRRDPVRARELISGALVRLKTASGWSKERDEAAAWITSHDRTRPQPR